MCFLFIICRPRLTNSTDCRYWGYFFGLYLFVLFLCTHIGIHLYFPRILSQSAVNITTNYADLSFLLCEIFSHEYEWGMSVDVNSLVTIVPDPVIR